MRIGQAAFVLLGTSSAMVRYGNRRSPDVSNYTPLIMWNHFHVDMFLLYRLALV